MTQREALAILKMGYNVYLTGAAGSGKTFLLRHYIRLLKARGLGVGITASTGIAATHLDGMTIHSWAGIGIKDAITEIDLQRIAKKGKLVKRFKHAKVLIIDEVSMLHARHLELVDRVARYIKGSFDPFGGMQIVLCGDLFQLPPVARDGKPPTFIHQSPLWRALDLKICYLHGQYRQVDDNHLAVLNAIRTNTVSNEILQHLRGRYRAAFPGALSLTKLSTHNIDVDVMNLAELKKVSGEVRRFIMESRGPRALIEGIKRGCLAPEELVLKKGAFVMFLKNNFERGYVNGTLGAVIGFSGEGYPVVKTLRGKEIIALPESWQVEEDGAAKAEVRQIPLRLAWAITVHKSQGMTLDAAEIDLSRAFEPGMGYVALSRVRTLSGLRLMGLNDVALQVNPEVFIFDQELRRRSEAATRELYALSLETQKEKQRAFLGIPKEERTQIKTYI